MSTKGIEEVIVLIRDCEAETGGLARARSLIDASTHGLPNILKTLGLEGCDADIEEQLKHCLAGVICAYQRARLAETTDPRSSEVKPVLKVLKKAPRQALQIFAGDFLPTTKRKLEFDPHAARQARQLVEEAALEILVERMLGQIDHRSRGSMVPPDPSRFREAHLAQAKARRRGHGLISRPRDGNDLSPLAPEIKEMASRYDRGAAEQISFLGDFIHKLLFDEVMVSLLETAIDRATENLPDGRKPLVPPPGLTLAWGAVELIVAFAPLEANIRITKADHGPLATIVNSIHFDIAYPDERRKYLEKDQRSDPSVAADYVRLVAAAWKKGHRAVMFCDDATAQREHDRADFLAMSLEERDAVTAEKRVKQAWDGTEDIEEFSAALSASQLRLIQWFGDIAVADANEGVHVLRGMFGLTDSQIEDKFPGLDITKLRRFGEDDGSVGILKKAWRYAQNGAEFIAIIEGGGLSLVRRGDDVLAVFRDGRHHSLGRVLGVPEDFVRIKIPDPATLPMAEDDLGRDDGQIDQLD